MSDEEGRAAGRRSSQLDARAVVTGAAAAMAVALPAALVGEVVVEEGDSGFALPLFALVLIGFGVGGFVAGRRAPWAPLSNGAVAALATYVIIQGVGAVRRVMVDESVSLPAIVFAALLASSTGLLGALFAARTHP